MVSLPPCAPIYISLTLGEDLLVCHLIWRSVFKSFASFSVVDLVFLLLSLECSSYVLVTNSVSEVLCKHLFPVRGLSFCFLSSVFQRREVFHFNEVPTTQLIRFFPFMDHAFGVAPKKALSTSAVDSEESASRRPALSFVGCARREGRLPRRAPHLLS